MNTFLRSLSVSVITLLYIGYAYIHSGRPSSVPIALIFIFVPIMYGIFGTIDKIVTDKYKTDYSLLVGAILGLVFSLIGHLILDLPKAIFNYKNGSAHIVHVYAMILYAMIFKFIVHSLNN